MDIVYTVKASATNDELKYSLRTIENLPHDRVYIIGGCPEFVNQDTVTFIPTDTLPSKYDTTLNNLKVACSLKSLSEDFIWMNDDFYILQKVEDPMRELNLQKGSIRLWIKEYKKHNLALTKYMLGVEHTLEYLKSLGIPDPACYEMHTPFVYNKSRVKSLLEREGLKSVPMIQIRSVYGNIYNLNGELTEDVKVLRKDNLDLSKFDNKKFMSSSDFTWPKLEPYIKLKFNKKGVHEL